MQVLPRIPMEDGLVGPRHIRKHKLARLGLSRTRLTCNDNRLVLLICDQLLERVLGYHKEMRTWVLDEDTWSGRGLTTHLRAVVTNLLSELHCENWKALVRIYTD